MISFLFLLVSLLENILCSRLDLLIKLLLDFDFYEKKKIISFLYVYVYIIKKSSTIYMSLFDMKKRNFF